MDQILECLREDFEMKRGKNARYSLRSYSSFLGVSPTSLSLYFRGRRELSLEAKKRALLKLGPERAQLAVLLEEESRASAKHRDYTPLDFEKMEVLGDWYYFAILSLAEIPEFSEDPEWIGRRLNISPKQAETAVERLLKLGMLVRNSEGALAPSGKSFATPDQVASLAVRRSHYQALELARTSLDRDSVEERGFHAMTMAIDPSRLEEARKRIKKFNRKLCEFLEGGEKKEVYRLATQLFPLSRKEAKDLK